MIKDFVEDKTYITIYRIAGKNKQLVGEGIVTKKTSHGVYVWDAKSKVPKESAQFFPAATNKFEFRIINK